MAVARSPHLPPDRSQPGSAFRPNSGGTLVPKRSSAAAGRLAAAVAGRGAQYLTGRHEAAGFAGPAQNAGSGSRRSRGPRQPSAAEHVEGLDSLIRDSRATFIRSGIQAQLRPLARDHRQSSRGAGRALITAGHGALADNLMIMSPHFARLSSRSARCRSLTSCTGRASAQSQTAARRLNRSSGNKVSEHDPEAPEHRTSGQRSGSLTPQSGC
jgi:hypothetical protein